MERETGGERGERERDRERETERERERERKRERVRERVRVGGEREKRDDNLMNEQGCSKYNCTSFVERM